MPNPFFNDLDANPNEAFGVRACSFAGQQKHADCAGRWRTWHIRVAGHRADFLTVCEYHLKDAAADLFVTPKVTERKPRPAKRTAARDLEDVPSL